MRSYQLLLTVITLFFLTACNNSNTGDNTNGNNSTNESETDELVSTASLEFAGTDRAIPVLTPRTIISRPENSNVALSPDGSELAVVTSDSQNAQIETIVTIYSTTNQSIQREFSAFRDEGVSSRGRVSLVLWSEDGALSVLYEKNLRAHVFDVQSGEVLLTGEPFERFDECRFSSKDIAKFDPKTNRIYCIKSSDPAEVHTVNTRTLTRRAITLFAEGQYLGGLVRSHDSSELAFEFSEDGMCCVNLSAVFFDSETFQTTRENGPTSVTYGLLGDGFDVVFDERSNNLRLGSDGFYLEASSNFFEFSTDGKIAALARPIIYDNEANMPDPGFRVVTLPEGIVVGDVIEDESSSDHQNLFSIDGSTMAYVADTSIEIYSTDQRTNYTVVSERRP